MTVPPPGRPGPPGPPWPPNRPEPGRPWPEPPGPGRPLPGPAPRPAPAPPLSVPGPTVYPAPAPGPDPLLDRLLDERIVYLGRDLDDATAHRVITQLLLLGRQEPGRGLTVTLNALGGSLSAGLAVYDTLRATGGELNTRALGLLGPMAALLLAAGTPSRRQALPHAQILLRRPRVAGAGDPGVRAGLGGPLQQQLVELLARHTGRPAAELAADLDAERWLTAPEAVDYGLVDSVVEP